jgi:hypothetical protein
MDRFSRRTVKVTKEHNEECRRLLRLMGIPVVVVWLSYALPFKILNTFRPLRRQRPNAQSWLAAGRYTDIVAQFALKPK